MSKYEGGSILHSSVPPSLNTPVALSISNHMAEVRLQHENLITTDQVDTVEQELDMNTTITDKVIIQGAASQSRSVLRLSQEIIQINILALVGIPVKKY